MARIQRRVAVVAVVASLLLFCVPGLAQTSGAQPSMVAKGLEARLYAPCCYRGTLDGHESDLASQLRTEIEARLNAGESEKSIEADFVARYGAKIIAVHENALGAVGVGASLGMVLAGIGLIFALRPSKRTARQARSASEGKVLTQGSYEARLDTELEQMGP